jgi:hypothetical protein
MNQGTLPLAEKDVLDGGEREKIIFGIHSKIQIISINPTPEGRFDPSTVTA